MSNTKSRMLEAYTDTCSGSKVTDEWFGYDADGRTNALYESTAHSGGYYSTGATYWANGAVNDLVLPKLLTLYYGGNAGQGLDCEGRVQQVLASSGTNPVSNVTYSPTTTSTALAGSLTGVSFPSTDSDAFTYDPNTGRQTSYQFSVNGASDKGTLTWNSNATLGTLNIVDNIPGSRDSQTCNYFYDDLGRLAGRNSNGYSADSGSSQFQQLFSLDPFGNITKTGNFPFVATYSAATNHITNLSVTYDANGNLLHDDLGNNYTWDPNFGNPASINGIVLVYDALGRMVEQQSSSNTEIAYSPLGKAAIMNGQNLVKAYVGLPGGSTAIYNSSGALAYYRHSDWLGNSRVTSNAVAPLGGYSVTAYGPFGEQYDLSGTSDPSFTGQNSDTVASLYDFEFREHSPSQGRWVSPDPAGLATVDPTNPQTWNRYAYVLNNPLSNIDPLGLDCIYLNDDDSVDHVLSGDCASETDNGYYVDGTIVGGANGINNSNYGTAGPDGTLNFYVQGQTDPNSICVTDCTGAIGGVSATPSPSAMQFTQTSSTTWSFTSPLPFQQTVQSFQQTGFVENPEDYLDLNHRHQLDLRDTLPLCSAHVDVDKGSGSAPGSPTTGTVHLDTFNPWYVDPGAASEGSAGAWSGPAVLHLFADQFKFYPGSQACSF